MTISAYLEEVNDKWSKIVDYKNNNDLSNYSMEVHALKSSSRYIGFTKLGDIAYQHELKSKENDSNFVLNNFEELNTEFKRVLEVVNNYVKYNNL